MYYFKQPNGKYGRYSTVVETVTHFNLSREQLKQDMIDRFGKYDTYVEHFDEFVDKLGAYDGTRRPFYLREFDELLGDIRNLNETTRSVRELFIGMGMDRTEVERYWLMKDPTEEELNDDEFMKTYTTRLLKK